MAKVAIPWPSNDGPRQQKKGFGQKLVWSKII
jgi:hypothetical protein